MGSCIAVHIVTAIVAFTQVRMTIARICHHQEWWWWWRWGASVRRREERRWSTYTMLMTLLTSHCPMSWLKAYAYQNMDLYADTKQNERVRSDTTSGHITTQWCGVGSG